MLKVRSRNVEAPVRPGGDASQDRFRRRQRSRRWRVVRRLLALLTALGLVVTGVWLVFFSSVLAVQGAEVRGTVLLSSADVTRAAQVPVGEPLATADLAAVQARVEDLVAVDAAVVSRAWPDHLRIDVTEREAVAVVSWEGRWRGLDDDGVLFRTYPQKPRDLPRLQIRAATDVEALAEAATVVAALPADVRPRVDFLDVRSIDSIAVHLTDGVVITWGSADQSADKARVLEVLLEQDARVYDVTAPGRPTIRR